ncbi:MAG: SMI1/KNR4 family protein [Clostridia bacterium]|nr:SMI1/KNR4 family protein [Clostridia bacterium]
MSCVNFEKYSNKYSEEPMKGNIERLVDYDLFHCLLKGGMSAGIKVAGTYKNVPKSLLDWIAICDGGQLFDTVMLSTKDHDKDIDLDFDTYEEINNDTELKSSMRLPDGYVIFAIRSYGDPICFSTTPEDDKIYLWDCENGEFSDIWETFEDWLTEEIDEGIHLIADDVLEPLNIKLGGDIDE